MLTDLAKVVVDQKEDPRCDTGGFKIVHRAKNKVDVALKNTQGHSLDMTVTGTKKRIEKVTIDQITKLGEDWQ